MLLQLHPLPTFIYNVDSYAVIFANEAAVRQYGYTAEEFTRLTVLDLRPEEDRAAFLKLCRRRERVYRGHHRHMRSDGSLLDVEVSAYTVLFEDVRLRIVTAIDVTEQVKAAQALVEQHVWLRAVSDGVPDAIFVKDLEGRLLFVNQGAATQVGMPSVDLIGRMDRDVFGDGTAAVCRDSDREVLRLGAPVLQEEKGVIDGQARTFSVLKAPLRHADGTITGIVGVSRDITERAQDISELRRTHDALQKSEAKLRFFFENMAEGVLHHDASGRFTTVNPAAERILRYTAAELCGKTPAEIGLKLVREDGSELPADERPSVRALKTGQVVRDVILGASRLGDTYRWLLVNSVPQFREPDPKPYSVFTTFTDITRLIETERELRTSQERLEMLLRQAPAVMWTTDCDLVLTWCDGAGFRALDQTPEQATGISIYDWFPADSDAVRVHLAALGGQSGNYEAELSGRSFTVHADPLRDRNGDVVGVISLALDSTAEKIAERTLHEQEEQLRQAQKMEAIGRLAGGVAHDFNNMLTAITGHAEFVLDQLDTSDPIRDDLEQIRAASDKAADLTRQLLAFSRRQILQPKVISLFDVARDMEGLLRRLIGEDIELSTVKMGDSCCVRADRSQIEQVIMNLAVNARDAMPRGGELRIELGAVVLAEPLIKPSCVLPPGEYALLIVRDTGTGISADMVQRIFEPFFTTKEQGKGTGLGLSTVYGVVKQSGGFILVDSELGNGTSFSIFLPRVYEQPDAAAGAPPIALPARCGETVLLVEDEPAVRHLIERVLQRNGYNVLSAQNGGEALMISDSYEATIDLVLTDVVMPHTSGPRLADQLAAKRPDVKVLFISGYTEEAIQQHGVLRRGSAFVQKPFTPQTLAAIVREVLDAQPLH